MDAISSGASTEKIDRALNAYDKLSSHICNIKKMHESTTAQVGMLLLAGVVTVVAIFILTSVITLTGGGALAIPFSIAVLTATSALGLVSLAKEVVKFTTPKAQMLFKMTCWIIHIIAALAIGAAVVGFGAAILAGGIGLALPHVTAMVIGAAVVAGGALIVAPHGYAAIVAARMIPIVKRFWPEIVVIRTEMNDREAKQAQEIKEAKQAQAIRKNDTLSPGAFSHVVTHLSTNASRPLSED